MKFQMNKILSVLLASCMIICFLQIPAKATDGDANGDGYYDPDVAAIREFLNQDSVISGQRNGDVLKGSVYDPDDPSEYNNVTWTMVNGCYRATEILWDMSHGYNACALAGSFDATPLKELTSLTLEKSSSVGFGEAIGDQTSVSSIQVAGLSKLVTLNIRENALSSLDLSGCSSLTYLDCQENNISSLTLTGASAITYLNCGYNNLSGLNISGLTNLQTLWVFYNHFSSLDVSPFADLVSLDCQGNDLTTLDISNNPLLEQVYCGENNISTLDLSGKTYLTDLDCYDNGMTSLNLSGCTALRNIYCADNDLTSLDLAGMDELQYLTCTGNRLLISDLLQSLPVAGGTYEYAPQQLVQIPLTHGNSVDLSSEKPTENDNTVFTWYNSSDNSVITAGITESPAGVFTFDRDLYEGTSIYCTITNVSFPSFSGVNVLRTASVMIQGIPSVNVPDPITFSGNKFSWDEVSNAGSYQVYIRQGGTNVRGPITLTDTSLTLTSLPGESFQTLPSGTYKIIVKAIAADHNSYLDSDWSAESPDGTITTKSALELVNEAASAAGMRTALETNKAALGISGSIDGTAANYEYADLTETGKSVAAEAMLLGKPYINNAAVATAFAAAVKKGVLADETAKYETSVTLAYDDTRDDGADVENLVRVLKPGSNANSEINITGRSLQSVTPNSSDAGGDMLAADSSAVTAPKPNWTGSDGTAVVRFTLEFGGVTSTFDVAVTCEPVPASEIMKMVNNAANAAEVQAILDVRGYRNNFGLSSQYVNYWDDENTETATDFTASEKAAVAAAVWNNGDDYVMNLTGKSSLIVTYKRASALVFINRAKAIIGTEFTAVERKAGVNLLESLRALPGMADTNVAIAIEEKSPADTLPITEQTGTVTFNASAHVGTVSLSLSFDKKSEIHTIDITIPAKDTAGPIPGNNGAITAANITQTSITLNWTAAADDHTDASEILYYVVMSESNTIDTYQGCEDNGPPLNPTGTKATSYQVTGLTAGKKYYFNIAAKDRMDNISIFAMAEAVTAANNFEAGGTTEKKAASSMQVINSAGTGKIDAVLTKTDSGVKVKIGGSDFKAVAADSKADVIIDTGSSIVTFDAQAAGFIGSKAGSGEIVLTVEKADASSLAALTDEQTDLIGTRPVYDFTLTAGGSILSEFDDGCASISIPYELQSGEDKNAVLIYYIDESGKLQYVRSSYNEKTGKVEFTVKHFSLYAVAYNKVDFSDIAENAWYSDAVTYCAARGITSGVGNGLFAPENTLTRGQLIAMLMRAYNIAPADAAADNFADAGSAYYTPYLAAAKKLGISNGIGENLFAPDKAISREEMFTLLYRTLDVLGELPEKETDASLSDYIDSQEISGYAGDALDYLVSHGIVSGSSGELNPGGKSTRAQMVQVLYNLLAR